MGHKTGVTLQRLVKQSVPPDKEDGGGVVVGVELQRTDQATCPLKPTITSPLDNNNNLRKQKQLSDNLGKNLCH